MVNSFDWLIDFVSAFPEPTTGDVHDLWSLVACRLDNYFAFLDRHNPGPVMVRVAALSPYSYPVAGLHDCRAGSV
jgi:hypothetical protein